MIRKLLKWIVSWVRNNLREILFWVSAWGLMYFLLFAFLGKCSAQPIPRYKGELLGTSVFGAGFNSGQGAWQYAPGYPGWTTGDWPNPYGQTIFIKAVRAYMWCAEGGVADMALTITRKSDGSLIDYLGWDHYAEPNFPQEGFCALPGFVALNAGDGLHFDAHAFNGSANLSTGTGIFGVGASVAIQYTVGTP